MGCARNEVDSEELAARLEAAGWTLVEDADSADAVVVNTCGFVDAAKQGSIDTLLAAAGEPDASLTSAHTEVASWLANGQWKSRFPGKGLFRDVRGYVYNPAALGARATGVQPDIDLAVAVAPDGRIS